MYENPFEMPLSGLKIKDWIWHHTQQSTRYTSLAKRMSSFFNLDDNKTYILTLEDNVPIASEVKGEKQ